jgi:hypothetical protein
MTSPVNESALPTMSTSKFPTPPTLSRSNNPEPPCPQSTSSEGYPSRLPSGSAPRSRFNPPPARRSNSVFGSDGGAGPADHPGGASASEDLQRYTTDAPAFSGGRKPAACSARIVSIQDSNTITATGTGGRARREMATDRITTRVLGDVSQSQCHIHHDRVKSGLLRLCAVVFAEPRLCESGCTRLWSYLSLAES